MTCIATATPADALICYVIYDRNENVIYQNTYPPVDMSNAGYAAARCDARPRRAPDLRRRRNCPTVVFLTGAGGISGPSRR